MLGLDRITQWPSLAVFTSVDGKPTGLTVTALDRRYLSGADAFLIGAALVSGAAGFYVPRRGYLPMTGNGLAHNVIITRSEETRCLPTIS